MSLRALAIAAALAFAVGTSAAAQDAADGGAKKPDTTEKKDATEKERRKGVPGDQAEGDQGAGGTTEAAAAAQPQDDPDLDLNLAQPDFTTINMPTALRVPRHKSAFRVTHRFTRPMGSGDFGSLVEDFFGIDSGAQIGLEYRFGLFRGTQVGIHRTNDRTIEFFAQHDLLRQSDSMPVGVAVLGTMDGTNNFRHSYSPGLGAILSRTFASHGAIYLTPMWVNNTNPLPSELTDDNDAFLLGIGARVRIRPTLYLVGEVVPRLTGFDPGAHYGALGLEKRLGGHSFQVSFANGFGSTMGQIARGGSSSDDWYLGFHISRKFF